MDNNLNMSIIRRKEEMYNFYYKVVGNRVKKKRIELKLTQEALAKGICSNTYISKLENNKIVVNKEHLFLLMEKMDLPADNIGYPEKMVEVLEQSIKYFFYKDIEAYTKLFEEIKIYEFGILIYIARLGYYVLTKDHENAKIIYDDMFRYLSSLEDYGFATFLIFGGFYNLSINDYQTARMLIETVEGKLQNDQVIYGLFSYLKFLAFGNLHYFGSSRDALAIAENIFMSYSNLARIQDILYYKNIFNIYEHAYNYNNFEYGHKIITDKNDKNYFLILLSLVSEHKLQYLNMLEEDGEYYIDGMFLKAKYLLDNKSEKEYKEVKKIINDLHYKNKSQLDYINLLKMYENSELTFVKDYLINYVLPSYIDQQNIFIIKYVIKEIVRILEQKNRYKDALMYHKKYDIYIEKFRTHKKNAI